VYGLGQFGFAMTALFSAKHASIPVEAYDPVTEYVTAIQKTRSHPVFHKGVKLGFNVVPTAQKDAPLKGATVILLAVPGQYFRDLMRYLAPLISGDVILVNLAKAVENGTNKYMSEIAREEMAPCKHHWWFVTVSGGMIAEEVTRHWPIAADVACSDEGVAAYVADLFQTATFKLNTTTDVLGVELAGALKNVVAIGAGFYDGLGYEMSSKAAYMSEAAAEVRELAVVLGAQRSTFDIGTHAWLGDLLTTGCGNSRNRLLGELLGKGMSIESAIAELEKQRKRSEGYLTSKSVYFIARQKGVATPFLDAIYRVLHTGAPVQQAVTDFWQPKAKL
jgi:glycerol-3-phosphate dehydrogenase (NAD(P)+)